MPEQDETKQPNARWPVSEMLLRGTFATGTTAERRVVRSSRLMLFVLLGWVVVAGLVHPSPVLRQLVTVFLCLSLISYYAYEKRRYFLTLDELSRRIEMEGMAWAYGIGVLASMWLGGIVFALSLRWPISPKFGAGGAFFLVAIILALIKGVYRYAATRRY